MYSSLRNWVMSSAEAARAEELRTEIRGRRGWSDLRQRAAREEARRAGRGDRAHERRGRGREVSGKASVRSAVVADARASG